VSRIPLARYRAMETEKLVFALAAIALGLAFFLPRR
jgi:hypothetical protein